MGGEASWVIGNRKKEFIVWMVSFVNSLVANQGWTVKFYRFRLAS